jgi:hypothetical protein
MYYITTQTMNIMDWDKFIFVQRPMVIYMYKHSFEVLSKRSDVELPNNFYSPLAF